jgi:hypothetical protein
MMQDIRARFIVTLRYSALVCAAWLLSVTCTAASPITIGTFQFQNEPPDPFATDPTFVVFNDSAFAGYAAIFADIHLLFDLTDLSTRDFALIGSGADGSTVPGQSVDSSGLVDDLTFLSRLPDLGTVLDAYLTLTLLDPLTNMALAGVVSLGPANPPDCDGCTTRMTDFAGTSRTMAIQFEPTDATPVPEPASLLLVGSGVAAFAVKKRWLSR